MNESTFETKNAVKRACEEERERESGRVPRIAEDAGVHGQLVDEASRLGLDAGGLGVLSAEADPGRDEEGAVHHDVPLRSPVPVRPLVLLRVHALRYLRRDGVIGAYHVTSFIS